MISMFVSSEFFLFFSFLVFIVARQLRWLLFAQQEAYIASRTLRRILTLRFAIEALVIFLLHKYLYDLGFYLIIKYPKILPLQYIYDYVLGTLGTLLLLYALRRFWLFKRTMFKKPLIWTARVRLTMLLTVILYILLSYYFVFLQQFDLVSWVFVLGYLFLPILFTAACLLCEPLVFIQKILLKNKVKAKLHKSKLQVIGIAGSFGKTSTKHFLANILSKKYKVLFSPESYNTFFGLGRYLLDHMRGHDIFIAEMGVYTTGEVEEICEMLEPKSGIMCAIGFEHYERFKSIEKIKRANYELVESIAERGGFIAINTDNEFGKELYKKASEEKGVTASAYSKHSRDDVSVSNIHIEHGYTKFDLLFQDSERWNMKTRLLGRLNPINLAGCVLVAKEMGISKKDITDAVHDLEPVPHRLQSLESNGVVIIDDAYNSNPDGFAESLWVLGQIKGGKKILVTPGMVELGKKESEENVKAGQLAAKVCDLVIIVGTYPGTFIMEGLELAGFKEKNIYLVKDLEAAQVVLKEVLKPGDVVLFENDLPDIYNA